jgi:hypothetical protein
MMDQNDREILEDALYCIKRLKEDPNFTVTLTQSEIIYRIEDNIQTVLKHHEVLEGIYVEELPKNCTLFSVREFRNLVDSGNLIDYDGFGHPAKNINGMMKMAKSEVRPSDWERDIYEDTTHIVWFNK